MTMFETPRLRVREFQPEDAAFILELVNEPDWLRFIGDRGIRDLDAAGRYIVDGPRAMQVKHGFALWCVEPRTGGAPLGMCGLIKRDTLEHVDIGFAFLARHRGLGYAREAAQGTLEQAGVLGLKTLAAITDPANVRSIHLLESLGFRFQGRRSLTPGAQELSIYLRQAE